MPPVWAYPPRHHLKQQNSSIESGNSPKRHFLPWASPGGRSTVSTMRPEPRQWTHPKVYRVNLGTRGNCQPGPQPLATAAEIPASQPVTRTAFSLRVVQAVLHWSPWLRILALDGVCASSGFISGARSAPTSATTAKTPLFLLRCSRSVAAAPTVLRQILASVADGRLCARTHRIGLVSACLACR